MKHGGPAFPTTDYYDEKPIGVTEGMAMRDFFAAAALQGLLASGGDGSRYYDTVRSAYQYADAMLKVRKGEA